MRSKKRIIEQSLIKGFCLLQSSRALESEYYSVFSMLKEWLSGGRGSLFSPITPACARFGQEIKQARPRLTNFRSKPRHFGHRCTRRETKIIISSSLSLSLSFLLHPCKLTIAFARSIDVTSKVRERGVVCLDAPDYANRQVGVSFSHVPSSLFCTSY